MRFTITAVLLLSLCSICPANTPSPGSLSIPDEASWLSYYSFRSSHLLLSRDALNGVLSEGHRLRLEAASASLSSKMIDSPEDGFRSLDAMIDAAAKDGLDARSIFAPTLSALRSKLLEGKPEIAKNLESISERLDATPLPSADSRSGYLAWLATRCGAEGETPDTEYMKAFSDAPWDKGLLKFWGDLHYFSRRFDKAIEIYRRALAKGDSLSTDPRYSPFFESEVRQRIGQCHLVCDRFDSAAVELERASTLASPPESAVSRLLAAHGLIRAKAPDAALPLLAAAQRDAGGPGAPLPDAIVNSLKVQEALAWSAKGDPKKVLELLSGFERSPDPAFLLPSDRKMTWRLLGNAYLLTGDGESAEEMANKAESEPPLTTIQKADPMAERYGEFVDREAGAPAHIRFYLPDANSLMKNDEVRIKLVAGTTTPLRIALFVLDESGFTVNESTTIAFPSATPHPINGSQYQLVLSDGPGTVRHEVTATGNESGITIKGAIVVRFVGLILRSVKIGNSSTLLRHFEDLNGNGVQDSADEHLSDGSSDPTKPDEAETDLADAESHWTAAGAVTPFLTVLNDKIDMTCRFIETPSGDFTADVRGRYNVRFTLGAEGGSQEFTESLQLSYSSNAYEYLFSDVDGLSSRIGVFDTSVIIDAKVSTLSGDSSTDLQTGTAKFHHLVGGRPVMYGNAYLCLLEHAAKHASSLKSLHESLATLTNDFGKNLSFDPSAVDDDHYRMHPGRLLDRESGNAYAWAEAFTAMATFLGRDVVTDTFEFRNFGGPRIECLNAVPGLGERSGIPPAPFNVWLETFPGVPREKRGDFVRDQSKPWRPLRRHSYALDRSVTPFDLYDPSFSNHPFSIQQGIFKRTTERVPAAEVPGFVNRYLLEISPNILFRNVSCYNRSGSLELLDLARPAGDLVTRTAEIVFYYGPKAGERPAEPSADEESSSVVSTPDLVQIEREPVSDETEKPRTTIEKPPAEETAETRELKSIVADAEKAKTAAEYRAVLTRCRAFYDKYPGSDYRSFVVYMSVRLMHLGIANKEYRERFHIPGWWHGDKEFQDLKTTLMTGENRKLFDWLFWSTTDTVNFDGWADTAFMLGQYARTAGDYATAVDFLLTFNDPKYKEMHPWILASLGEACANRANEKPEARADAIHFRMRYLLTYGGQDGLDHLTINVLFSLASDLLFEKRYAEAESVLISNIDHFPAHPAAPGLLILLAHSLSVKDSPDFAQAEEVLQAVLSLPSSDPDIARGFNPWARLVLARMYMRAGEPEKTVELSERFERIIADRGRDEPADKHPADKFHAIWEKMQFSGVLVQKALALNSLGRFSEALDTIARIERDFKDETTYTKTKFGRPFPPMVLPAWGDDIGDWSDLLHRSGKVGNRDRKVKARVLEGDDLRIRFVNPFETATKFTKAMALWNRAGEGDRDEALKLLNAFATSTKEDRDYLSNTVVGADPFLIAISPQPKDEFKQLAKDFLNGKILADVVLCIDNPANEYDASRNPYFAKGSKHKFIIRAEGIGGVPVSLDNYVVIWKENKNTKRVINGEIDISTNDIGEKKCEFIIASKDGFITIHKNLNYIVYNLSIVSPTEKYYKNANNLNDIKLNNSYINYAFCFEENRNCDILCRLKIEPDTEELRKAFEGKIHGSLEEIAYGNDKLTLTWNDQITVGSEKRGKFAYDAGKGEWVATSTYSGLPAPPPKSYGRVPRNMKKLLYGKRKAAIIAPEFESEYNYNTTYEIYYGNNFKISDVEVIYITKNENILKNIFSDFNDDNMTIVEEIYEKMICSTGSFNFSNMKELSDNIKMRILAIKYINKVAVADPSFRVFGFDGNGLARAGDCYYDILMKKWINGKYWRAYNTSDKRNKRFLSYSDKSAYDSIMNIFPYHGECLGSMSICVILSSANVIGKNDFDNIYNNISISIGFWWSKDLSIHFKTPSDTDTYLPGDHLYMKNYDNYIDVHPNGAWQGENTLYIRNNFNGVMGDGVFSGQGVKEYTEDRLYNKLLEEYRKGTGAITIPLGNIEFINHKMINTGKKY